MARKVTTTTVALRALRDAKAWLMQPGSGPAGARKWRASVQARRNPRDHPFLGGRDVEHPEYRVLVASGDRLIYRVVPDTGDSLTADDVLIVRVIGPGQETRWP